MSEGRLFSTAAKLVRLRAERENVLKRLKQLDAMIADAIGRLRSTLRDDITSTVSPTNAQSQSGGADHLKRLLPVGQSFTRSPLRNRIILFMEGKGNARVTTDEIARAVGMTDNMPKLFWTLSHIRKAGYVERVGRGVWRFRKESLREGQEDDIEF